MNADSYLQIYIHILCIYIYVFTYACIHTYIHAYIYIYVFIYFSVYIASLIQLALCPDGKPEDTPCPGKVRRPRPLPFARICRVRARRRRGAATWLFAKMGSFETGQGLLQIKGLWQVEGRYDHNYTTVTTDWGILLGVLEP